MHILSVDRLCSTLKEEMVATVTSTIQTEEEMLTRFQQNYRAHLYINGVFEWNDSLFGRALTFIGTVSGERRTVTVYK